MPARMHLSVWSLAVLLGLAVVTQLWPSSAVQAFEMLRRISFSALRWLFEPLHQPFATIGGLLVLIVVLTVVLRPPSLTRRL